ncbi:MAG TPA: hypothetical protein VGM86_05800 [Thermoanaerobaculia bacterium]|jgi:hypothetical protein
MAQRVCLLPVEPRIVELLGAAILEDPGRALADLRASASREGRGGSPEDWQSLAADAGILRRMRKAALAGRSYEHQVKKQEVWGDDLITEETRPMVFEGPALAEIYGQLLGSTLGRLLGLSLPTWELGSGYSLGLLLAGQLSLFPLSGARRMRARLSRLAETPATLLAPVAMAGFEAGFPRVCEPYGTGLYFPPAAVREIHAALTRSRKPLVSLGVKATGLQRGEVERITVAVHEAFGWAAGHGLGLLEGDELVEA